MIDQTSIPRRADSSWGTSDASMGEYVDTNNNLPFRTTTMINVHSGTYKDLFATKAAADGSVGATAKTKSDLYDSRVTSGNSMDDYQKS